jgi:hypothetical protein
VIDYPCLAAKPSLKGNVGRYSALKGQRVEVHYRAGDIYLSAQGTLVEDDGKSIYLEERFSHKGKDKMMRVDIPYEHVTRITKLAEG